MVTDKRRWSKDYNGEVCRVCCSKTVHTQKYGEPTMECIYHLQDTIKGLEVDNQGLMEEAAGISL